MDKLELLFIRACKSKEPGKRLQTLYKRKFHYCGDITMFTLITSRLIRICKQYGIYDLEEVVSDLNYSENRWEYHNHISYYEFAMIVFMGYLRYSKIVKFPGYSKPARFRGK